MAGRFETITNIQQEYPAGGFAHGALRTGVRPIFPIPPAQMCADYNGHSMKERTMMKLTAKRNGRFSHKFIRNLAAGLVWILLLSMLLAAIAESFSAYVSASSMAVYSDTALSNKVGTLSGGTVVTVLSYQGGTARVSYNGNNGYAKVADMTRVDAVAKAATVNTDTRVYKSASVSSSGALVSSGTKVNVIAVNAGWALVERNGAGGFMLADALTYADGASVSGGAAQTQTSTAATVTAASVKVYRLASTNSQLLGTLKQGATLNVAAADITVNKLVVDVAGMGTVKGVSLASSGTVDIVGDLPADGAVISAELSGLAGYSSLASGWTFTRNGGTLVGYFAKVVNGGILVRRKGMSISFR